MYKLTPKENFLRLIRHDSPEYIPYGLESVRTFWHRDARFFFQNKISPVTEWTDAWGTGWKLGDPNMEESFHPVTFPLKDLDEMRHFNFPDPCDPGLFTEIKPQIEGVDRDRELIMFSNGGCLFTRAWLLRGMENFLADMLLEPEKAGALLDIIYNYQEAVLKRELLFEPDMVYFGDDAGTGTALLMAPALWRRMIKPRLAKLINVSKEAGCFVLFHCCGHVEDIMDDIIEMGVDILHPVQAGANNLPFLKSRAMGKLTFFGGINADAVVRGSPEEIKTLTKEAINILGRGGGYIAHPDQLLPFPKENIEAIKETVLQEGRL